MMRSGRLLVEESPNNLLYSHGVDSLEDVFLKLCVKSESMDTIKNTTTSPGGTTQIVFDDEKQLLSLKCPHISPPQLTKVISFSKHFFTWIFLFNILLFSFPIR